MATQKQLAFVHDVETGVAAIKAHGRNVTKISEVLEAGGRYLTELNSVATRLVNKNGYPELIRLQKAFAEVGLKSRCVDTLLSPAIMANTKTIEYEDPFALEPSMPEMPAVFFAGSDYSTPEPVLHISAPNLPTFNPSKALTDVIAIIAPLSTIYKQRVLQSAGLFYGVGE